MTHPFVERRHRSRFDPFRVRADFPILGQEVRGKRLAYLDNAATTQKPEAVLRALARSRPRVRR